MNRSDVLLAANDLVTGDRERSYGPPNEMLSTIAVLWEGYKGADFSMEDVAAMLSLVKIARLKVSPKKMDNWVDCIGYLALGAEVSRAE